MHDAGFVSSLTLLRTHPPLMHLSSIWLGKMRHENSALVRTLLLLLLLQTPRPSSRGQLRLVIVEGAGRGFQAMLWDAFSHIVIRQTLEQFDSQSDYREPE